MKKLILIITAFMSVVACSALSTVKEQPSLVGTSWILADQVKGEVPTLNIEGEKVSGNAGCNNYFGQLAMDVKAGKVTFDNMGATKKMCDNISVEDNYLKLLGQVNKYKVTGKTLELYKDNLLLLKFNKN